MDMTEKLIVRFFFDGEFINDGSTVHYIGGREELSYIDRDKVSLPEVVGHLKDHCSVEEGALLHWLFPGKDLKNGLRVLVDDKACLEMSDATDDLGVAEIYVEAPGLDGDDHKECSDFEDELEAMDEDEEEDEMAEEDDEMAEEEDTQVQPCRSESREDIDRQIQKLELFYRSPSKKGNEVVVDKQQTRKVVKFQQQSGKAYMENNTSSDSDYMLGDSWSSEDDDEAAEIMKKFKEFKKNLKQGGKASLDDVVLDDGQGMATCYEVVEDKGNETPYANSSDDEDSVDEMGNKKNDWCPRFKKTSGVPKFELGMKFRSKKQFKKAIIRYGLAERRVIVFIKDEPKRVRAICDWEHCPWVCLLSNNSRSESWQIVTYKDYHTCPPRRDNKLVTARRIAEKYEKFIMANPGWNFTSMKETVQEEMFVDVHISKLKRAKAIVMQKAMDALKGQYQRLYDYQLELLRSNPGSTVIVVKELEVEPPTFQRIYICLDALKKGFLAGCRRVIGLDGCFFKGATSGELLCAIGRDANNQMYPVAWAVVERENNESWDWFCDLL